MKRRQRALRRGGPEDEGRRQEGLEEIKSVAGVVKKDLDRKVAFWQSLVKHSARDLAARSPFCLWYLFDVSRFLLLEYSANALQ